MDRQSAILEVKRHYADYLKPANNIGGRPSYVCPICGNGTGHDKTGIQADPNGDGLHFKCFKCDMHGDLIEIYQRQHGCDFNTALNDLCGMFGIILDNEQRRAATAPARATGAADTRPEPKEAATADFTAYYEQCRARLSDPAAQEYLSFRGISTATAERYGIGYDPQADPAQTGYASPRIIVPFTKSSYMGRSTTGSKYPKLNSKGGGVQPFNLAALYSDGGKPVFIVEGAFDALSIIEAGGDAVAINSAANVRTLLDTLKRKPTVKRLIVALDNDGTGDERAKVLCDGLKELGVPHIKHDPCGGHHDANDALRANRQALAASIAEAERAAYKPDNMRYYIMERMSHEADALQEQAARKTGFSNLDAKAGAIYSGLYAIGGISSVGKTSFITQLADQMAARYEHVLFFSMEQSRLEIASKSIARRTAMRTGCGTGAKTALQIRLGDWTTDVIEAFNSYVADTGERVSVIEGNFNCTVGYIRRYVAGYMEANKVKPVVFVDYLQVLQADVDPATGRRISDKRLSVDYNVTELKRMSRELDIPVFVVSSVNRASYLTAIDFESFKESGGIEFTSDVVWGLQLAAVNDDLFKTDEGKDKAKKRERIAEAKEAVPREIELVCLKNRYGRSRYSCKFVYDPRYDLFEPKEDEQPPAMRPTRRL